MSTTAMDGFLPILMEMMRHPPAADEPVPLANNPKFATAITIPFLVISFLAVFLRLHTRFYVVRKPGWDDAFVIIAALSNLVGQITFIGGIHNGIGRHLVQILQTVEDTMKWFYVANAAYTSTTVFIKLSLLCQYLRLFRGGYRRVITIVLLIVVSLWGGAFSFMAWFPCFPVSGFWDKTMTPPAKCYAFGYRTIAEAKSTLLGFAGSNMLLDILVFMVPLTEYFRPNLKRKQVLAMTGLFSIGLIVVLMAVLRLWSGLKYNNRGVLMYDFTFWLPEVLIFSCLEIDLAIIAASMPIFWPTVMDAWNHIYVTKEVIVTREARFDEDHKDDLEMANEGAISLKSHDSIDGLVDRSNMENSSFYCDPRPQQRTVLIQPLAKTARVFPGASPL